ncbi:MAG: hypothetical protein WB760_35075 [Xanthobacteraceae bacterium]
MLRKFAVAMLATALIAGPAFAASPPGNAGSTPATVTAPASTTVTKPMAKPASKMVKHFRRHVVRHKVGKIKVAQHFKSTKAPRHHLALRLVKHSKFSKVGKINKTSKSTHS